MASAPAKGPGRVGGDLSPRSARAKMEEALGKLDISDVEATPLVIDDCDDEEAKKWMIAGKVLHRTKFHFQTISSALRPAWGNPKGLIFRPAGENMYVAVFDHKRDYDWVWEGSPWHVSRHAVILSEFDDCMRPSELRFDKIKVWARVANLPFHLRKDKWAKMIAQQIDPMAEMIQFDHEGGYLRSRVSLAVKEPLRRWVLIESAKRKSTNIYEVQYENIPNFCFSCGRLGHADLYCATPGTPNANGKLPFGPGLRPVDERKKAASDDSAKEQPSSK